MTLIKNICYQEGFYGSLFVFDDAELIEVEYIPHTYFTPAPVNTHISTRLYEHMQMLNVLPF